MTKCDSVGSILLGVACLFFCCEGGYAVPEPDFVVMNPNPTDGQIYVSVEPNLTLSWDIGDVNRNDYQVGYKLFLGTDRNEVETSTESLGGTIVENYTVTWLEHDTEYFWRIDMDVLYFDYPLIIIKLIKGEVWSFATAPPPPRVITVDDDGPADFNNIQAAIDDSNDGDTVLVADGTYTGDGNRDIDFHGKAITVKSENGPETCIIDCDGSEWDEHRAFYFHSREGADSAVIGFTITNSYPRLYCRPWPPFTCYPRGGAIQCEVWYGPASPTIRDCIICSSAAPDGVGVFMGHDGGFPTLVNCTISGNGGGALYAEAVSGATLTNCILWDNGTGEAIREEGSPVVTASYCNIEGGWAGRGNIDADPCFADPENGDFHLKSQGGRREANDESWVADDVTSPCIDAGDPMSPIGFEPFPNGGIINMGAYGGTDEASKSYFGGPTCETITAGDVNGDCIVDYRDFQLMALHWCEERGDGERKTED